jgi:hypothetical protein
MSALAAEGSSMVVSVRTAMHETMQPDESTTRQIHRKNCGPDDEVAVRIIDWPS